MTTSYDDAGLPVLGGRPADVPLTVEEERAVRRLQALARSWPRSLMLFVWGDSLCVLRKDEDGGRPDGATVDLQDLEVASVPGIDCEAGDP